MNMNDWKIGTRIAMGYAAVILVTIALAVYAHTQLVAINSSVDRITKDSLPGTIAIFNLKIGTLERLIMLEGYLATADASEIARLSAEGLRLDTAISGFIAAYEKTINFEKDKQLFAAMLAARAPFVESVRDTIQNARELRNKTRAREMYQSKVKPLFTKYAEAMEALVVYNNENTEHAIAGVEGSISKAENGLLFGLAIALVIGVVTSIGVTRGITKPLAAAITHLEQISHGDFSKDLPAAYLERGDEIGVQARAMQAMSLSLRTMIKEMSAGIRTFAESSASLLSSSGQMSAGSRDASHKAQMVAAAAEQMSSNVTMVASSMEQTTTNLANVAASTQEMTATIGEIAVNSERARGITADATRQAARITEQMNELGQAARDIGKVTEAITEISSQTNLLALNATIEAARAGSAGKGFAVVANEIKALAQQTAAATEDIKARISGVQNSTVQGVAEIKKVSDVINQVSDIVASIAAAIEEQATATKDIARNIAEASTGVQDVNIRVAESSQVSVAIATDIVVVHRAADEMASGSEHVSKNATALAGLAETLRVSVAGFQV